MNFKILSVVVLMLILTACSGTSNQAAPRNIRLSQLEAEQPSPAGKLAILTSRTMLRRGESGIIVVKGTAGVTYSISASYNAGGKSHTATENKTASPDGIVTWTWYVAPGTANGVYPIEIKGDGEYLRTTYTVSS